MSEMADELTLLSHLFV